MVASAAQMAASSFRLVFLPSSEGSHYFLAWLRGSFANDGGQRYEIRPWLLSYAAETRHEKISYLQNERPALNRSVYHIGTNAV